MEVNDARLPEMSVAANGVVVAGVLDAEICNDSFMGADRYRLSIALTASGYDIWSENEIDVEISLGLDERWQTMISGPVDNIEVDIARQIIHVEGRDMTARLIEARIQETFENQTASEIAVLLAGRRGLIANVTSTSNLVGRDFGGDHASSTLDQYSGATTEWDLLVKLAFSEDFDVWIDKSTLNFGPYPQAPITPSVSPSSCLSLQLEKTLCLCSNLEVIVKSWDCRAQQTVTQVARQGLESSSGRTYILVRPNLTATNAARLAVRSLSEMTKNARMITFEQPGDLTTRPPAVIHALWDEH